MFIVKLAFSDNGSRASALMEAHNAWLRSGFADQVFLLAGSLKPGPGGGILAHNTTLDALQSRVDEDPFVAHNVVSAEILEITPAITDERLRFLQDEAE